MRKINLFNVTMRTCCMLIISVLLISGCASSPRLISPKQLGPQKVLLVKAGDAAGEESLKLSEMFQEVSRLNVVLNPNKYIVIIGNTKVSLPFSVSISSSFLYCSPK